MAPTRSISFPILLLLLLQTCATTSSSPPKVLPRRDATIALFIQISDATLTLVPRLLRSVWHPENIYILHFDKKIPVWQREHTQAVIFKSDPRYPRNVHILQSEIVTYRGISMVLNTLNAMQLALDKAHNWDYFINISGSDYPLVSPSNLRNLLGSNDFLLRNRSFFSFANPDWWVESKKFRFDRLFTDTSLSMNDSESQIVDSYSDQPIATVAHFTYVAAEAWMTLHRSFVNYLLKSPFSRRMFAAFAYSAEPEEHYFVSVAFNSQAFNLSVVPHALRHVSWVHNGQHAGQHPYYVDRREANGSWTFEKFIKRSGCFFTRKIRNQDSDFLQFLDERFNGLANKSNPEAVAAHLATVQQRLDCLAKLNGAQDYSPCFPKSDQA